MEKYVIKSDGRKEEFNPQKIIKACLKAGTSEEIAKRIADEVSKKFYNGMPTREIRNIVISLLNSYDHKYAEAFRFKNEFFVSRSGAFADFEHSSAAETETYERFMKSRISDSLVKETGMPREIAEKIAWEVEHFLFESNINFLSGHLLREIACYFLLKFGYEKYYRKYTRVGLPIYDIKKIISGKVKENANLQWNPETVAKLVSDETFKEYALLSLIPREAARAHLSGEIHIHDLDYYATRPFCMSHDARFFLLKGLKVDGTGRHTVVCGPAKKPEIAVLHLAKVLSASQVNCAGGQGFDFFNVFLAPYLRGLSYEQMKQIAQTFIYEMCTMYVARGGQTIFSSISLEFDPPKYIAELPAVKPGGKVGPETYEDYIPEARQFLKAITEVYTQGDYLGRMFEWPKPEFKIRQSVINGKLDDLFYEVAKLTSKFGSPYFLNMAAPYMPSIVNSQCLHHDEPILIKNGNDVKLEKIGDLIDKEFEKRKEYIERKGDTEWLDCNNLEAITYDSNSMKMKWIRIKRLMRKRSSGILKKITLNDFSELRVSPDHLMVVIDNGVERIKFAKDIKEGDIIPICKKISNLPILKEIDLIEHFSRLNVKKIRVCNIKNKLSNINFEEFGIKKYQISNWKAMNRMPLEIFLKLNLNREGVKISYYRGRSVISPVLQLDENFGKIIGYFLSEGDINEKRSCVRFSFNFKEKEIIKDCVNALRSIGLKPKIERQKTAIVVNVNSRIFVEFLLSIGCGKNSKEMRIPNIAFNLSDKAKLALIVSYINGDGYIRNTGTTIEISIHTPNKRLLLGIQYLLLTLGIPSKIRKTVKAYALNIPARFYSQIKETGFLLKALKYVHNIYKESLDLFNYVPKEIYDFEPNSFYGKALLNNKSKSLTVGTLRKYFELNKELIKILEGDVWFLRVNKIEDEKNDYNFEYDIELDGRHIFLVGQRIFTHNCCRFFLTPSSEELEDIKRGSIRSSAIQYVTINLPRIAYEAKGDDDLVFEIVRKRMEVAKLALDRKHEIIEKNLEMGLLPFLSQDCYGEYYYPIKHCAHNFGFVGLNEMLKIHTGDYLHESKEAWKFGLKVIKYMADIAEEYNNNGKGYRYNVVQTPAESTAYRLAIIDLKTRNGNAVVQGDKKTGDVYYTNSSHVFVGADIPLWERIKIESSFHPLVQGGAIMHVFMGEKEPEPEAMMKLTKKIASQTLAGYWAYTRDFTWCNDCMKTSGGMKEACPHCGSKRVDHYSRVTGYYQRVESFNAGKRAEVMDRKRYSIS